MADGGIKKFFGWLGGVVAKAFKKENRETMQEIAKLDREFAVLEMQAMSYRAFRSPRLAEVALKMKANRERYNELRRQLGV